MVYKDNTHVTTQDLLFKGILNDVKRTKLALQPIFEAFTNAMEAIKIRTESEPDIKGEVQFFINASETTIENNFEFDSLTIIDNGIGFNEKEFKRFNTFKDFTKGFKNLGSGRIQYAHCFDKTSFKSVFREDGKYYEREFIVSKQDDFLKKNAIVFHKHFRETNETQVGTRVTFNNLLEKSNVYNSLTELTLKEALIERYIHYFCYNRSSLPSIELKFYVQSVLKGETSISEFDIPTIDKTDDIKLSYYRIASDGNTLEKLEKSEDFKVDAFKVKKDVLQKNNLKLVSKGEIVEESNVVLDSLAETDNVKGYKYLFLVSSDYIDLRDTNMRGVLNIPDKNSLSKNVDIYNSEEIFVEDIQEGVNEVISSMYPEIEEVKKIHQDQLDKLKEMFLLDNATARDINISINDNENKILEKFYEAEAKKTAAVDASIKESIDRLDKLDTTSDKYTEELKKEVEKLVRVIPLQNKISLTHYVARRKLVLNLFDKILQRQLEVQKDGKNSFDEALIHNLLFQQGSNSTENSDLWIINEEFIYFKGSSEKKLSKLEIDGKKVFKEKFTEEEERYLTSLGENRKIKRPDVLLFPDEGKCIIIEFKAPNVNASDHLTQIDRYANLIRNYTEDFFQITTFFGYLIGESIEPRDVLGTVSRYEHSYQFDYLYRPSENVIGFDGRSNGSIYSEVLKYSTLLERARRRNKVFIEKLQG